METGASPSHAYSSVSSSMGKGQVLAGETIFRGDLLLPSPIGKKIREECQWACIPNTLIGT